MLTAGYDQNDLLHMAGRLELTSPGCFHSDKKWEGLWGVRTGGKVRRILADIVVSKCSRSNYHAEDGRSGTSGLPSFVAQSSKILTLVTVFGMVIRCAVRELPEYTACPEG